MPRHTFNEKTPLVLSGDIHPDRRAALVAHYKSRQIDVVFGDDKEAPIASTDTKTDNVNGTEITTKTPVIETKEDSTPPPKKEEDKVDDIPEDLKCPHCGTTARTPGSYARNHGEKCFSK